MIVSTDSALEIDDAVALDATNRFQRPATTTRATVLTDKLVLEPRLRLMSALLRPVVTRMFRRRHHRLRRHFPAGST